jgi:hypothetical protein
LKRWRLPEGISSLFRVQSSADEECMAGGSWLFPDDLDRLRMLELDRELRPVRRAVFVLLTVALVASGPWLGWWTLIPMAMAAVLFRMAELFFDRLQRPDCT